MKRRLFTLATLVTLVSITLSSQKIWVNGAWVDMTTPVETVEERQFEIIEAAAADTIDVTARMMGPMSLMPAIYDHYDRSLMAWHDTIAMPANIYPALGAVAQPDNTPLWLRDALEATRRRRRIVAAYLFAYPGEVKYNTAFFSEMPKLYKASIDPTTARVVINEVSDSVITAAEVDIAPPVVQRRNWLHDFDGLVQFTQAYNSPNWYQGGNSNMSMLVNAIYKLNLNTKFHPDLLFENTLQCKLVLTSAPGDKLRDYSINEDLLQLNSKFGVRAFHRWFYTLSLQAKTQMLNNYITDTNDLQASFMSPGEVNVGAGMTYTYLSKREVFAFDLTIAPLSYNLVTCLNDRVDGTAFGVKPGHKTASQFGANIESKINWKIAHNITLSSRLYAFTNYSYVQSDLEATLSFSINKFLSTQIYGHLRYDSQTPHIEGSKWHKWQLKEIFSFGFAYKFSYL